MPITELPAVPVRGSATFNAEMNASLVAQKAMVPEINAQIALLNAGSGMGAYAIAYTFSTTTTDADPGNGNLRLNQATQNTATVIRADLLDSAGATQTPVLDTFDDTAGAIKGYIRLVKTSDSTKWLVFSVSAVATPSGYRNITVANIGSSAASPFADTDAIMLYFTPLNVVNNSVGDHEVSVHTGNGYGSTNTKIRRFTTTLVSTGTAITYADSATLGATFTINETGIYSMRLMENVGTNYGIGISLNSSQLTTSVSSINVADRLAYGYPFTSEGAMVSCTARLVAGSIIRVHAGGAGPTGTDDKTKFTIVKVNN